MLTGQLAIHSSAPRSLRLPLDTSHLCGCQRPPEYSRNRLVEQLNQSADGILHPPLRPDAFTTRPLSLPPPPPRIKGQYDDMARVLTSRVNLNRGIS